MAVKLKLPYNHGMKTLLFILISAVFYSAQAAKFEGAEVINSSGKLKCNVGQTAQLALRLHDSSFNVMELKEFPTGVAEDFAGFTNETPMCVMGDFDGDGIKKDFAAIGKSQKNGKTTIVVYMLILENEKYKIVEVRRWNNPEFNEDGKWEIYLGLGEKLHKAPRGSKLKDYNTLKTEVYYGPTQYWLYYNGKIKALDSDSGGQLSDIAL